MTNAGLGLTDGKAVAGARVTVRGVPVGNPGTYNGMLSGTLATFNLGVLNVGGSKVGGTVHGVGVGLPGRLF